MFCGVSRAATSRTNAQEHAPEPDPVRPEWVAVAERRLARYLRCLRCPRAELDDVVQEALLAALRSWPDQEPPLPWLFVTARNLWLQRWRRRQRDPMALDALHEQAVAELGDDGGDARVAALRDCVAALPQRSRLALRLCYDDAMPRRQAATRLGLSVQGLQSLLRRLKDGLRECVRRRSEHDA